MHNINHSVSYSREYKGACSGGDQVTNWIELTSWRWFDWDTLRTWTPPPSCTTPTTSGCLCTSSSWRSSSTCPACSGSWWRGGSWSSLARHLEYSWDNQVSRSEYHGHKKFSSNDASWMEENTHLPLDCEFSSISDILLLNNWAASLLEANPWKQLYSDLWRISDVSLIFPVKGTTTRFIEDQEEKRDKLVSFFLKNIHNKWVKTYENVHYWFNVISGTTFTSAASSPASSSTSSLWFYSFCSLTDFSITDTFYTALM